MPLDETEEISARLYYDYLTQNGIECSWAEFDDDPPDLIFEYENKKVAVEVTRLTDFFEDPEGVLEINTPLNTLVTICSQVEELLGPELKKNIQVFVTPPLTKKRRLLEEIVQSAKTNFYGRRELLGRNDCYMVISEIGKPEIVPFLLRPDNMRHLKTNLNSPLVDEKITYSLEYILKEKIPRLERLSGYDERILIIYNEHLLGHPKNIKYAIEKFALLLNSINQIFLVYKNELHELFVN